MNNTLRAPTDTIESLESRLLFSTITIASVSAAAAGTPQQATFTALLDAPSTSPIKLSFSTFNGTAKAGVDYKRTVAHIAIPAGATSATFSIALLPNITTEDDRAFGVKFNAGPDNTVNTSANVTIIENHVPPTVTVSDATILIGLRKKVTTKFFIGLTTPSSLPITIGYSTADVTANADANYTPVSGTLSIPARKTGGFIKIKIVGDAAVSPDKVFNVNITGATNALVPAGLFSRVVIEDHAPGVLARPIISVSNPSIVHGGNLDFVLNFSSAPQQDVTVRYFTATITADASQFAPVQGILNIPAGAVSATISVPTTLNTTITANTQLRLILSAPANATVVGNDAIGTIIANPTITVVPATVDETGAAPLKPLTFVATLDAASRLPVSFHVATVDGDPSGLNIGGNAVAGVDYVPQDTAFTFQPGQTSLTFTVPTLADVNAPTPALLTLNLTSPVNGILGNATALGTINNLSAALVQPTISIADAQATVHNGQRVVVNFTISLDGPSTVPVSVNFATADGTAFNGVDYTGVTGTLVFNPGETSKVFPVTIHGASATTVNLDFTLVLSNPVNAALGNTIGTAFITELAPGQ